VLDLIGGCLFTSSLPGTFYHSAIKYDLEYSKDETLRLIASKLTSSGIESAEILIYLNFVRTLYIIDGIADIVVGLCYVCNTVFDREPVFIHCFLVIQIKTPGS
jgi:hypothetical protein